MPGPGADEAVGRGLAYLEKIQEADGSFTSFSSASMRPFRRVRSWQTVFVPALMLASLAELPGAMPVRGKLAHFLLGQQDSSGAFNYWSRGAAEYRSMAYPNDLDDTFCALAALQRHDASLIDGAVLAKAIRLLLAAEAAVGGPYRTWLVPPDSAPIWTDVDPAVNSNIAYFLSLVSNRLPKLDDLMGAAIAADSYVSPYYPSGYAFVYYFARAYGGPHRGKLLAKARRLHAAAASDLDRAVSLTARLRLGDTRDLDSAVSELLAGQRRDGSWPAAGFYADPVKNGKLYYNGAAALTTAFVLEALQLAGAARAHREPAARTRPQDGSAILSDARKQCRSLPADLRRTTLRSLAATLKSSNGGEITGLPHRFNRSLLRPLDPAPAGFLERLSLANLFGWTAYTIYDDFLDEEGSPGLLPAANAAHRGALSNFSAALPDDAVFQALVKEVFDTIDGANAWEQAHCRWVPRGGKLVIGTLPDYGDLAKLAERSLGHTLAPLAVLHAAGTDEEAIGHTRRALAEYLIVRQLNDDLHDWQEDLEKGHITCVAARILSDLKLKRGSHGISGLLAAARPRFWHKTLPAVCAEMRRHIAAGRQAAQKAAIFKDTGVISQLFDGLEASIEDTLAKQRHAENFLKHY
jgi:hypothetical protein